MHERAKRASTSETYRPLFSHMVWRYKRQYWTKHWHWENLWINYASERGASELGNFSHFHILKLLFPSIFYWYFWYFISETHIFSGLKLHLHIHTINAVPCYYLWYGVVYKRVMYTDKTITLGKSMYMRASLENFLAFLHSKTAISFNILLVLQILCPYKWHACRLTCPGGGGGGGGTHVIW